MALKKDDKKAVIDEVTGVVADSTAAVVAEYRGLTVADMYQLRSMARDVGAKVRVVKNTLARRAFQDSHFSALDEALVGPTVLLFSGEEISAAAKVSRDFAKINDKFVVKALSLGEELIDASQLSAVATLPTKDEAISQLMAVMLAPTEKLARTLNEVPTKVVRVISAVKDTKAA